MNDDLRKMAPWLAGILAKPYRIEEVRELLARV